MTKPNTQNKNFFNRYRLIFTCLFLVISTFSVYWQVHDYDFVNYDDVIYVTTNPYVQSGLSADTVRWAFISTDGANWHPLTWLSHILDVELFGMDAGPHHLTSLLLHTVNGLLLFIFLYRTTEKLWPSSLVAALFALHPLHVESVAWISERKDVLSTFFWMLTLNAYFLYSKTKKSGPYLSALAFFALGLMAKPMVVTLPFVLLLLDYWPLARWQTPDEQYRMQTISSSLFQLIYEKIPFFTLTLFASGLTFFSQQKAGAVASIENFSFSVRVTNALVSYMSYAWKMFWPFSLSAFYPHPGQILAGKTLLAVIFLFGISLIVWRFRFRQPYLIMGWLWYLGTLVPVVGLIQVGDQAMADRYTYIPLTGLFIMIAWILTTLVDKWPHRLAILRAVSFSVIVCCAMATFFQVRHWQNSVTLFSHAAAVTQDNAFAHRALGSALSEVGKYKNAIPEYKAALKIKPAYQEAHFDLGLALAHQRKFEEAVDHFRNALQLRTQHKAIVHHSLGMALRDAGHIKEGIVHLKKALQLKTDYAKAYYSLAKALQIQGDLQGAINNYQKALEIADTGFNHNRLLDSLVYSSENLDIIKTHFLLAKTYLDQGNLNNAIEHYQIVIQREPQHSQAYLDLGVTYARANRLKEALDAFEKSFTINPSESIAKQNFILVHLDLAFQLRKQQEYETALKHLETALFVDTDNADVKRELVLTHNLYGAQLGNDGDMDSAIKQFKSALLLDPDNLDALRNLEIAQNKKRSND